MEGGGSTQTNEGILGRRSKGGAKPTKPSPEEGHCKERRRFGWKEMWCHPRVGAAAAAQHPRPVQIAVALDQERAALEKEVDGRQTVNTRKTQNAKTEHLDEVRGLQAEDSRKRGRRHVEENRDARGGRWRRQRRRWSLEKERETGYREGDKWK